MASTEGTQGTKVHAWIHFFLYRHQRKDTKVHAWIHFFLYRHQRKDTKAHAWIHFFLYRHQRIDTKAHAWIHFSCIDINRKAFEGMKFYTCSSNALLLPFHLANFTWEKVSTWSYCEIVWRLRQDGNLKHRIHIFDKQISSGDSRDGAWLSFLVSCKIHDRMKFLTHQDVCFEGHRAGRKNIVYVEAGKECKNVDIRWSMIHDNWKAEDKSLGCEKQEGGVWMRNLPTPTPPPQSL